MRNRLSGLLFAVLLWHPLSACGDTFTIKEDDGKTVTIDARLVGERQGLVALERADGRIEVVPQQQVLDREAGVGPQPISCETMINRLTEDFGADLFRARAVPPYVVGLVLSEPINRNCESKVNAFLNKGVNFMKSVEKAFLDFTNDLKIETEKPRYPLVLIIFEADDDFMQFATKETGGKGLSAGSTMGYYSSLTNRLVIRMSECHTFTTPLHEAVHQQVFNRGIMRRLSPVPVWFNEGIATGFEGNGDKISGGPLRVNKRYAMAAKKAKSVNWDNVVADDKAFRGDVSAGDAYAHAWSIHWFLVTKYRKQYVDFLQIVSQKPTLQIDDAETRVQDFERAFGKSIGKLQVEFLVALDQAALKQNISLVENAPDGYLKRQANLAEVEVTAADAGIGGGLETEGHMRNLSYIRPMSFHIIVETDAGTYAEWYLPNVPPFKVFQLSKQLTQKRMKGAPEGRVEREFGVKIRSVVPDSETGKAWQRGQLPVPLWSGG